MNMGKDVGYRFRPSGENKCSNSGRPIVKRVCFVRGRRRYWDVIFPVLLMLFPSVFLSVGAGRDTSQNEQEFYSGPGLPPPRDVVVDSVEEHAFTLKWRPPLPTKDRRSRLQGYMLSYSPVGSRVGPSDERTVMLPVVVQSKLVSKLREATEYAVVLSAVYPNIQKASAPKIILRTDYAVNELPAGDDIYLEQKIVCNCSQEGMLACTRNVHQETVCTCYPGYTGRWCEACDSGYIRVANVCQLCPCNNATSSGECAIGLRNRVMCKACLPGHRGDLCTNCSAGYSWKKGKCVPVNCLSYAICQRNPHDPGCLECYDQPQNAHLHPGAQKSATENTSGTVALVAVLTVFGFLMVVVGSATVYRFVRRPQNKPPATTNGTVTPAPPFWNVDQSAIPNEYLEMKPRDGVVMSIIKEDENELEGQTLLTSGDCLANPLDMPDPLLFTEQQKSLIMMVLDDESATTPRAVRALSADYCL